MSPPLQAAQPVPLVRQLAGGDPVGGGYVRQLPALAAERLGPVRAHVDRRGAQAACAGDAPAYALALAPGRGLRPHHRRAGRCQTHGSMGERLGLGVPARKPPSAFRPLNSSPEIIRRTVLMYVQFPLSLRNVEDSLAQRGTTSVTRRRGCGGTASARCSPPKSGANGSSARERTRTGAGTWTWFTSASTACSTRPVGSAVMRSCRSCGAARGGAGCRSSDRARPRGATAGR